MGNDSIITENYHYDALNKTLPLKGSRFSKSRSEKRTKKLYMETKPMPAAV